MLSVVLAVDYQTITPNSFIIRSRNHSEPHIFRPAKNESIEGTNAIVGLLAEYRMVKFQYLRPEPVEQDIYLIRRHCAFALLVLLHFVSSHWKSGQLYTSFFRDTWLVIRGGNMLH